MKRKRFGPSRLSAAFLLLVPYLAFAQDAGPDGGEAPAAYDPPPAAVTHLTARDAPDDAGKHIILEFERSADDAAGAADVVSYEVFRIDPAGIETSLGVLPVSNKDTLRLITFDDQMPGLVNGTEYSYKVVTRDASGSSDSKLDGTVRTSGQWFALGRFNMLFSVLMISFFILYFIKKAQRGEEIYLRPVAGLKAFDEAVGRATEMGKPVLYVPGIMDLDQVETVAGVIILGYVSKMTARYETELEVPVSRSLVMSNAREVCRSSYLSEGRPELYKDDMVHYLTDDQFAYAAGVDGIMLRKKPAACFYQGKFYAESLILAETGNSIGAIQIAGTASPSQLPFFITACDYTLIGEEFFAASAYLSKDPKLIGSLKGQDWAKGVVMIIIGVGAVVETLHVLGVLPFSLQPLLVAG